MFSHGCAGGDAGMAEQGHASPIDIPSTCVREGGHMGDSPSISTDHSVGMGIIGTEEARVDGCESR